MRNKPTFWVSIALIVIGLAFITYPSFKNWWENAAHVATARTYYYNASQLSQEEVETLLHRAYEHNDFIYRQHERNIFRFAEAAVLPYDYAEILCVNGVIARLSIPIIALNLPILHGTCPETLRQGVGHLEGSSLPIGGYGSHAAVTAHSGLNTRLFSRLHEMTVGDIFYVYVLDRRLVYQVDQIIDIWPHEIHHLRIEPYSDLFTLITCTPIHVNTHRLLVRGVRFHD